MAPVTYCGPHRAVRLLDATVFPRNIAVDVDDEQAGGLLARPDFRPPDFELDSREASGDGTGEPLPPLNADAYPPDATPLDEPDQED